MFGSWITFSGENMIIYTNNIVDVKIFETMFNGKTVILYPEHKMSFGEQFSYRPDGIEDHTTVVVTNSPVIVSAYRKNYVRVYDEENSMLLDVDFETYGASINTLIGCLMGRRSVIHDTVIEAVREKVKIDKQTALDFIETLGKSPERAFMISSLQVDN